MAAKVLPATPGPTPRTSDQGDQPVQATLSIFPKFYRHLDVRGLAALVREVGLDTTNLVIRDGYWVSEPNLAETLPRFVRVMRSEGLDPRFATTGYSADALAADPTPLAMLADHGIREFRTGYFRAGDDPRQALGSARDSLEALAEQCARHNIRAVYQVHHGTLIPNASAAWHVVNGLPAEYIGVELDPGNQSFEGFERWDRSARLLGEYLVAVGVKDTVVEREPGREEAPDKGWSRRWAPICEGVTDWHDLARALKAVGFRGTMVFMPFYDEDDPAAMTAKLKREVAYLRAVLANVEAEG